MRKFDFFIGAEVAHDTLSADGAQVTAVTPARRYLVEDLMPRISGGGSRRRALPTVLLGALLLLALPVLNGQVFFFEDTYTYVHAPDVALRIATRDAVRTAWSDAGKVAAAGASQAPADGVPGVMTPAAAGDRTIIAGRSFYYGAGLFAAYALSNFWLAALGQALLLSGLVWLLTVRCWGLEEGRFLVLVAALVCVTSVSFFAGFMLPDAFTPALVLAATLLLFHRERLGRGGRAVAVLAVLLAVLFHTSHLLLLAALLPLGAILLPAAPGRISARVRPLLVLAACLGLGIAGDVGFTKAVEFATGSAPVRLPHLSARLVAMGPGEAYLRDHCGTADFALCRFTDRMPIGLIDFVFSPDPAKGIFAVADTATKRQLAAEQTRFLLAVLADRPMATLSGLLFDGMRQLALFGADEMRFPEHQLAYFDAWFPPAIAAAIRRSMLVEHGWLAEYFTVANYTSVLAALLGLLLLRRRLLADVAPMRERRIAGSIVFMLGAVLLNGLILGALATPYDRYQARVVWLVPLLALGAVLLLRQDRVVRLAAAGSRQAGAAVPAVMPNG